MGQILHASGFARLKACHVEGGDGLEKPLEGKLTYRLRLGHLLDLGVDPERPLASASSAPRRWRIAQASIPLALRSKPRCSESRNDALEYPKIPVGLRLGPLRQRKIGP